MADTDSMRTETPRSTTALGAGAKTPFAESDGCASVVLSLGAGVQSSTMLLLAVRGELPKPALAIFGDTQDETAATYNYLAWLREQATAAGIPLETVTAGKLSDKICRDGKLIIPTYGSRGGHNLRICTDRYKVRPINRRLRDLPKPVELWIGISTDEVMRMKENPRKQIKNRWPLIELRMSRWDCIRWLTRNKYPLPPKSACLYCPYHSDEYWRALREQPEEWEKALQMDDWLNERGQYLHPSRTPLRRVDLRTEEDRGQETMFANECGGHCGL